MKIVDNLRCEGPTWQRMQGAHWRANSAVNPLENHAAPFGVIGYGDPNTLTGIEKAFLFLQAESIFIPLREMYSYRISHKTEGDYGFDLGLLGDLTQWLIRALKDTVS